MIKLLLHAATIFLLFKIWQRKIR